MAARPPAAPSRDAPPPGSIGNEVLMSPDFEVSFDDGLPPEPETVFEPYPEDRVLRFEPPR